MIDTVGSDYIKDQRRSYFLYTISSRALPYLSDGLKPSQRRGIWTARSGEKMKTASLAGATMPIHPHAEISDVLSNMAGPWSNNVPLLTGYGAFGTMLAPGSYGAPRYTSVRLSDFTKEVVLADIEIIPMQLNYDDTLEEPAHFLPLVPIVLLNSTFGIAGGFQCSILPYDLKDIIKAQLKVLNGEVLNAEPPMPYFKPTDCRAVSSAIDPKTQNVRYTFEGEYQKLNSSELKITKLPYGVEHSKFIDGLVKLEDDYKIVGFDDYSKDSISIVVRFPKGFINKTPHADIVKLLKLTNTETNNINVINFDGETVLNTSFNEIITLFTKWRLGFYVVRYERLLSLLELDIQRYKDVILAIDKNVGGVAVKTKNKSELGDFLEYIGVINIDYISSLPVYRFTEEEKNKTQSKLDEALIQQREYIDLLSDRAKRVQIYVNELKSVMKNHG